MTADTDWDTASYVISSDYRVHALERLNEGPATPTQISEDTDVPPPHISRALGQLEDKELVTLLVSEERKKGRVYGITDYGQEIWNLIADENLADQ